MSLSDLNVNNIKKNEFNRTSNENFNPALGLNAFQKKQRDNNSTMDNFQQRFLRCRISLEPKQGYINFRNESKNRKGSQYLFYLINYRDLRQKMLKGSDIFGNKQ